MGNMELWDEFKETNPKYTKSFKRPGGFSGTAIDSMYQTKRLTAKFGPCGKGWGWEILKERYVSGGPLKQFPETKSIIHTVRVRLWYKVGNETYFTGPQYGQTTFVGEVNANQYREGYIFTDEEHAKKSVTDAVSKCASMIGLGADIFMGMYDDNKYVNSLKEKYKDDDAEGAMNREKKQAPKDDSKAGVDDIPLGGGYDKPAHSSNLISDAQRKRLYAISKKYAWAPTGVSSLLAKHGFESSTDITKDKYQDICDELEHGMEGPDKQKEGE